MRRATSYRRAILFSAALVPGAFLIAQEADDATVEDLENALSEIDSAIAELDEIIEDLEADPESYRQTDVTDLISSSGWTVMGQAGVAFGADSNVLLAAKTSKPVGSNFSHLSADFQVERGLGRWGTLGFLGLLDGRIFEKAGIDPEEFGLGELSWKLGWADWESALAAEYLYSQSVFDATIDAVRSSGLIRERSVDLSWSMTRRWASGGSLVIKTNVGESRFGGTSFDYDRAGLRIEGRWSFGDWLALRSWGSVRYDRYVDADALPPRGFFGLLDPEPGQDSDLGLRRSNLWQAGLWPRFRLLENWSLSLPLWIEIERDHAGDYYDRDRYYARAQLEWKPGAWTFTLVGSALFIDYTARRLIPELRTETDTQWQGKWTARFEIERSWGKHIETFASVEYGALEANRPREFEPSDIEYSGWIGELGFSYSF